MTYYRFAIAPIGLAVSLAVSGCSFSSTSGPVNVTGSALHGKVYGGQQPISGASIQLYAAGSSGYGAPYSYASGTSLLGGNVVLTDTNGAFSISGDYTCPMASTPVYLVAIGGNPGLSGSVTNSAIALLAALGSCGNLSTQTFVSVNELTTVASVWALSPFMTGITQIGSSAGNTLGLANAFASVNKLVNIGTGSVGGPALPAGATLPIAKINTLANILAACVNSDGGTGGPCGRLFASATVGGVVPADTITAAMNIAHNPNQQTASLTSLVSSTSPFQPTLSSTPADFALMITYTGGALSAPKGIAADANGNVWIPNAGSNSVTEIDSMGVTATDATGFLSGSNGFTDGAFNLPVALAIDQNGSAWVANSGSNTVSRLGSNGITNSVFSGGNLNIPSSLAIDGSGNLWVTNSGGSSLTEISKSGTLSSFNGGGFASPVAIAINPR